MEKIQSYKELRVWNKGMELVEKIYEITLFFPDHEKFGLTSQIRRAAVSIPSNIAEGFRRSGSKEFRQFLLIAKGSAAELETQIIISDRLGYLKNHQLDHLYDLIDYVSKMLSSLISIINKRK